MNDPVERKKAALDLMTRIIAKENLTIIISENVDTAKMDLQNRIMVLPLWADLHQDVADTLRCHEVSHALYTPSEKYHDAIFSELAKDDSTQVFRNLNLLAECMNICEDIRIERLIKAILPELPNIMPRGAHRIYCSATGFDCHLDELESKILESWDKFLPTDKINIVAKTEFHKDKLSPDETRILASCMAAEDFEEIEELARELYWLTIQEYKDSPKPQEDKKESPEDGDEESEENSEDDSQDSEEIPEDGDDEDEEEFPDESSLTKEDYSNMMPTTTEIWRSLEGADKSLEGVDIEITLKIDIYGHQECTLMDLLGVS